MTCRLPCPSCGAELTLSVELAAALPPSSPTIATGPPAWLEVARGEEGVAEVPGDEDNARIRLYWSIVPGAPADVADEVPWCAVGLSWALLEAGVEPPGPPGKGTARSADFRTWGVELAEPVEGAIVVLAYSGTTGHVGIFERAEGEGLIRIFGGNQGDAWRSSRFKTRTLHSYRWPPGVPLPAGAVLAAGATR